jgi:hypothetical protein
MHTLVLSFSTSYARAAADKVGRVGAFSILQRAFSILQCAFSVLQCAFSTLQRAFSILQRAISILQSAFLIIQCAFSILQRALSTVQCAFSILQCVFSILQYAFSILQCSLLTWNRNYMWGTRWRSWARHCTTSGKVAGSNPDRVIEIFNTPNPSGRTVALRSTQPLT